ncbi:hypothetical protein I8751_18980 [Nostocaceae cyanobacterium CENA357]|uniref:PEP-CTERM protein-sorting domain-containing protein n=1 Tax=Atlanticothrix silvestris CENA357 TaxID=1725252 RepID=A0A8J7HFQ2_9CYAN|nr:hypothetical protein [Atlanticothrix silvestris]MBH8554412.1 hypothetical protein [Atlanticothrix silvestris CENA357]
MLRSNSVWFVPVVLSLASLGLDTTKAIAQTNYEFEAIYNLEIRLNEIAPNISVVTAVGNSLDAPYSLTQLSSMGYSRLDPTTGVSTIVPDAAVFGLEGLPVFGDRLYSNESDNSLIGNSTTTATINLENLTASAFAILNITGGTGRFSAATGTLTLTENYTISPDPTAPLIGQALIEGSFQTPASVPEPGNFAALVAMGAISTTFLLCRHNQKANILSQR